MARVNNFNFNKIKRSFFNVTLKDKRLLQVKMPKKKTFEKLQALQNIDKDEVGIEDIMDTIAALCAETLSHNLTNEHISAEYINENYDIEEMFEFIKEFYVFVGDNTNSPN